MDDLVLIGGEVGGGMDGSPQGRRAEPGRPLSIRALIIGGVLVGLVGAAAVAALL